MSRQILHEVRDVLRAADAIASEREFCERWLGKSECYMRTLRFSQIEPSADALATVSNKLKYYAEQMHSKDAQHLKELVWSLSDWLRRVGQAFKQQHDASGQLWHEWGFSCTKSYCAVS